MKVAFEFSSTFRQELVDRDGRLVGENSGVHLLRRLMALFPDPILLGAERRQADGFTVMPLDDIDVNQTLVVCFDPLQTPEMYRRLKKSHWHYPKLVNFVWFNVGEYTDRLTRTLLAVSCSMFPTFCNSSRTLTEVRQEIVARVSPAAARQAQLSFAPLGIDVSQEPQPRVAHEVPTVLYPAMWLFARKDPERWLRIVIDVADRVPITALMRLTGSHLTQEDARVAMAHGVHVTPLLPREELPAANAATDLFLATSKDESYGLQYLELLYAGVAGLFPDRAWASTILPDWYPYRYASTADAQTMLHYMATHLPEVRASLSGLPAWIKENHDERAFDRLFVAQMQDWMGGR